MSREISLKDKLKGWFSDTSKFELGKYYWVRAGETDIYPEIIQVVLDRWDSVEGKPLLDVSRMGLANRFPLSYYKDCEFLKINAPLA